MDTALAIVVISVIVFLGAILWELLNRGRVQCDEEITQEDLVRDVIKHYPGGMLENSQWKRRQRTRLFIEQDGKCYYCGCECILMLRIPPTFRPPNLATLEHLYDRNTASGKRENVPGTRSFVMACCSCNHERGRASQAALGVEELRRRASHKKSEEVRW
jgi:hypothetical protein